MVKVKAYIADLALCVHDADATIARMSRLFFHELSQKGAWAIPRHHTFPVRSHSKPVVVVPMSLWSQALRSTTSSPTY
jgi:hypothetical protein